MDIERNIKKLIVKVVGGGSVFTTVVIFVAMFFFLFVVAGVVTSAATEEEKNHIPFAQLSDEVRAYRDVVEKHCIEYDIANYVDLALAIMQQESGGLGLDPMQSSESPANIIYPRVPGGITDPYYSIDCGIGTLALCIVEAGVTAPKDIEKISLAVQGYNFGNGYVAWAKAKGGYNKENATEFAKIQAERLGWASYGDTNYVPNVLRYYSLAGDGYAPDGYLSFPLPIGTCLLTSPYGYRTDPFIGMHNGVDYGAAEGTPIYSGESGVVSFAGYGTATNGFNGYGNVVVIEHMNGYSTMYAHCNKLNVKQGDTVKKRQEIATVGNTGKSTGNHLHFEVRAKGSPIDPMPYLEHKTNF